jgi:hypothetical protein
MASAKEGVLAQVKVADRVSLAHTPATILETAYISSLPT